MICDHGGRATAINISSVIKNTFGGGAKTFVYIWWPFFLDIESPFLYAQLTLKRALTNATILMRACVQIVIRRGSEKQIISLKEARRWSGK